MDILETIAKFIVAPIAIVVWWAFRKYDERIDAIEKRMNAIEKEMAVVETKLEGIKEGIDDIKQQLAQIFEILRTKK